MTIHKGREPWPRLCALGAQGRPRGSRRKARERGVCVLRGRGVRCVCRWGRGPPFPRLRPGAPAFPCGPPQARPERRGGPSRASPAPVGFITCLLALLEPQLLLRSCCNRVESPRPAARKTSAWHARVLASTLPFTARSHTHPRSHSSPSHTRALTLTGALPLERALTLHRSHPLAPRSARPAGARRHRRREPEGTHGLPMADLSFIEDSVAFPEKEEDEEEEEEGVEWGYEEGNPPRVLRLARGVGPAALASSLRLRRPSFSRGSPARLGAAGAPGRAGFSGARPWCRAAVGICPSPVGEPEGCVGDSSIWLVARRAALTVTEHLENAALLKLLFSFFEKKKKILWFTALC